MQFEIEPIAKLEANLSDCTGVLEAHALMHRDARSVLGVDAADEQMIILVLCFLDYASQEPFADSISSMGRGHVDRMFNRVFVRGPRAENAIARKAHQFAGIGHGANYREVALPLGGEPSRHRLRRPWLVVIKSRGVHNCVVEDRQNVGRIGLVA